MHAMTQGTLRLSQVTPQGTCTPPDKSCDLGDPIARVTAVDRDQYLIRHAESEVPAKLTGRAVYASESPTDMSVCSS
jgi:hypothetical protein